ncbi:MAG: phage tail tape measure protein, partial [Bacteroidetes bacterium]|nr:phage tail tape measure protein [Bacteroidota bacterium]
MANPIKFSELVDKGDVEAGFDNLIGLYRKLEKDAKKSIKGIKEATKGIVPTSKGAAEAIRDQSQQFRTQKQVVDESGKAIKALTTAQQKLKTAQSNVGIETAKVRDAISRQNRLTKQEITLNRSKQGSMVAISAELTLNKQKYRELSEAQRANVNIGGRLLETVKRQDSEIKKLDSTIGNSQRNVGNYAAAILEAEKKLRGQETQLKQNIRALKIAEFQTRKNTTQQKRIQLELSNTRKKYGQIVSELKQYNRGQERSSRVTQNFVRILGALGLAGGITLVVRGFREMIGIFSGFEKQMAKVRAISGATDAEFKLLVNDAKRLGESTEKTAANVGELQLAFAKLGFTTPQIIAATEATLDLATATDEDLAQSALVAAKTIKGFNLSAEETARVTDVMALSFSSSALNLNAFQDAMKTVAPVALAVNSTLESTTAVLSTLVDAGLDASTAGTSLRNIFIELAKQGITWEDAMEQVRNSTNKLRTATDLFGKRASTAALIIADNSEKIDTLTESYNNAEGSAKAMADIMRDTLIGDLDRATSAIQGMVIQIGEKLNPILRTIIQGFTFFITNIQAFFKIIGIAGAGLLAYTLITRGATIAKRAYTIAVNIANIATKAFNTSVKANPLGLLVGLLAAAVAAFFAFRDSATEATESEEDFGNELERSNKLLDERTKKLFDLENLFIKQGENLINLTNNLDKIIQITKEQIGFDKIRLEVLKDFIEQRKLSLKQQLLESKGELIKIGDEIQTLQGKRAATEQDIQQSR